MQARGVQIQGLALRIVRDALVVLALTGLTAACGGDDTTVAQDTEQTTDSASVDANVDANVVDTGATDATSGADTTSADTSGDANATDNGSDAISDSADAADVSDTIEDAGVDTQLDTAIDVGADTGSDAAVDASKDAADATTPIVKGQYSATCSSDADCLNPCTVSATCNGGKCNFNVKSNACLLDLGNGKVECMGLGDSSSVKPCLACQAGPKAAAMSANLWTLHLDGPGENVTLTDIYKTGILWNFSDKRSVAGGKALYFGDPVKGTYNNNKQVGALAITPTTAVPKDLSLQAKLVFWLWLDTEQSTGDDLLSITVLEGANTTKIWTSDLIGGSTHSNWQKIAVDLGQFAGKDVQFQFGFETKDGTLNAFEGAYLDEIAVATGCCAANADCDDGNACTADACKDDATSGLPLCSHDAKPACCASDVDCDDKKACTLDLCLPAQGSTLASGGSCSHNDKPGCCATAADCDDQDACTEDLCPAPGASCTHANKCCTSDAQCNTGDPCKKGVCAGGQCTYTETCCAADLDCDDFNPCTKDACDKGKCIYTAAIVPGCCAPTVLSSSFNGSEEGWQFTSTQADLQWFYKDVAGAKSAPGVLKMGNPKSDTLNIANTGGWKVTAISPPITVLQGKETQLSFWVTAPTGANTSFSLRVYSVIDGVEQNWTTISGFTVLNTWKQYTFDLTPLGGKAFDLRMEYKPSSSFGNTTGPGIYVDDIKVESTCKAKACANNGQCGVGTLTCLAGTCSDGQCSYANSCCSANSDCNDGSLCTTDSCVGGKCNFAAIKGCCMGAGDCNDGNACTLDVCPTPGGQCQNAAITGCCLSSAQCDDKNTCTIDSCIQNKCVNANSCCSADADCADGETKCTTDKCVNQKCAHVPTGAPGCCIPEVFVNDFDQGDLKGITISNSAGPGKGWQINANPPAGLAKSPPSVLWYGDPAKGNFDFGGASNGKATTGKILLPASTPSTLSMWLYMDTESGTTFDNLTINAFVGGQKIAVFTKNAAGFGTGNWYEIKYDLSAYQGQEVSVEFDFNTGDGVANSGKGVFIDDLKILTNCGG